MRAFPIAALKAALRRGNSALENAVNGDDQMAVSHQVSQQDMSAVVHHLQAISAATKLAARHPHPRP